MGNGDDKAAKPMQLNVLKLTIKDLEEDSNFYLGKLRNVKLMCKERGNNLVLQRIVDTLYATDEGFVIPDEGGP